MKPQLYKQEMVHGNFITVKKLIYASFTQWTKLFFFFWLLKKRDIQCDLLWDLNEKMFIVSSFHSTAQITHGNTFPCNFFLTYNAQCRGGCHESHNLNVFIVFWDIWIICVALCLKFYSICHIYRLWDILKARFLYESFFSCESDTVKIQLFRYKVVLCE